MTMHGNVLVAPSLLSANYTQLESELATVADADLLHFDVMDGHFVPNLSFGPAFLQAVHSATELPIDAHLMVSNPDEVALDYVRAGASLVSFHMEAQLHATRIIDAIHEAGAKAGVAINPGTSVSTLDAIITQVDLVLVMSVNPGFGGQRFMISTFEKLKTLRQLCLQHDVNPLIEVDGGVNTDNAGALCAAGANILTAGSSVFDTTDRAAAVEAIRSAGKRGMLRNA